MPPSFALALSSTTPPREAARNLARRPPGPAGRDGAGGADLVAWAGAGHRAAFALVARHCGRALRLGLRVAGDPAEADRPAFCAVLGAERDRCYEGALAELRAARREVDAAVAGAPFDPAPPRAAMPAGSGRWTAFNAAFAVTMARAMAAVSPQVRAQVAAAGRRDG